MTRRSARSSVSSVPRPRRLEVSPEERGEPARRHEPAQRAATPETVDRPQPTPKTARAARSPRQRLSWVNRGETVPKGPCPPPTATRTQAPPAWVRGTLPWGASQAAASAPASTAKLRHPRPRGPADHQPRPATAGLRQQPNDSRTRTYRGGERTVDGEVLRRLIREAGAGVRVRDLAGRTGTATAVSGGLAVVDYEDGAERLDPGQLAWAGVPRRTTGPDPAGERE